MSNHTRNTRTKTAGNLSPKKNIGKIDQRKFKPFTEDVKKMIRTWTKDKIMEVVLTPGGGLSPVFCNPNKQKQKQTQKTFKQFLNDVVLKVEKHFVEFQPNWPEDDSSPSGIDLIEDIMPMFQTDTNDTTCMQLYDELEVLILEKQNEMIL